MHRSRVSKVTLFDSAEPKPSANPEIWTCWTSASDLLIRNQHVAFSNPEFQHESIESHIQNKVTKVDNLHPIVGQNDPLQPKRNVCSNEGGAQPLPHAAESVDEVLKMWA